MLSGCIPSQFSVVFKIVIIVVVLRKIAITKHCQVLVSRVRAKQILDKLIIQIINKLNNNNRVKINNVPFRDERSEMTCLHEGVGICAHVAEN